MEREDFSIGEEIGRGFFGGLYLGTFREQEVAIKKIQLFRLYPGWEKDALLQLDHPNVIKLLHWKDENELR